MSKKTIAIAIIILLISGIYLGVSKYFLKRDISFQEAETLLNQCQIYSIGQSHNGITNGYIEIGVIDLNGSLKNYRISSKYKDQLYEEVKNINSSKKCSDILFWIE